MDRSLIATATTFCWLGSIAPLVVADTEHESHDSMTQLKGIKKVEQQPPLESKNLNQLLRTLNHPLPAKRKEAARQLVRHGPKVIPQLENIVQTGGLESTLIARELLSELEAVFLFGARVQLRTNRSKIRWNEPFELDIVASNRTSAPMRIPWPAQPSTTQPLFNSGEPKAQVVNMLCVADWLRVTGPDGNAVDFRHEPIARDQAIERAVRQLAEGDAPAHRIDTGRKAFLKIPQFNRGWMRYPMLAAGEYTIRFVYQPQWSNESWITEGIGLVTSKPVKVKIIRSAPEKVRDKNRPMQCHVRQKAEKLIVELTNTWDRTLYINTNIGNDWPSHANLYWRIEPPAQRTQGSATRPMDKERFSAFRVDARETGARFRPGLVQAVAPGEKIVVTKIEIKKLLQKAHQTLNKPIRSCALQAHYANLAGPVKLRRELKAIGEEVSLPTHIYTGSLSSNKITLEEWGER